MGTVKHCFNIFDRWLLTRRFRSLIKHGFLAWVSICMEYKVNYKKNTSEISQKWRKNNHFRNNPLQLKLIISQCLNMTF